MNNKIVNVILTIVALIPMTYFLIFSLYVLIRILSSFEVSDTLYAFCLLCGILGYIGLLMNLKQPKSRKAEIINVIFLSLGIIGFLIFYSLTSGIDGWKWIITMKEPDEWLVLVIPLLITLYLIVIKGNQLSRKYQKS